MLSAILAVAEGLDRSHAELVGGLDVTDEADHVLLRVHPMADAELEVWDALRHLSPLERALGKPVRLEAVRHAPPALVGNAVAAPGPPPDQRAPVPAPPAARRRRVTPAAP